MGSLFILFATGESLYTVAERLRGARIHVGHDPCGNAIQKAQRVDLVEKSLGGRHGSRWRLRELLQNTLRNSIKLERRKNARDEADLSRFLGAEHASGGDEIESEFLTNAATQHGHHHCRHETNRYFRISEASVFVCKDDVARGCQPGTAGKCATSHQRYDRLVHATNGVENVTERLGVIEMLLSRSIEHLVECREISAGAEVSTLSVDGDNGHR